jgi:sugar/nucleoside kinase (ribokinase family)
MPEDARYRLVVGVGGIGTGAFFALDGNHTLGRNESRSARLLDVRDYYKLHIILHYVAVLLGAQPSGMPVHVVPIGNVGDDSPGRQMVQEMTAAGIDVSLVQIVAGAPTPFGICFQYPDGSGGNITATNGAAQMLTAADVDHAEPLLRAHAGQAIVLAAPEVPLAARARLLALGTEYRCLRVAALASAEVLPAQDMGLMRVIDLLSMNEDEGALLAGQPFDERDPQPFLDACSRAVAAQNAHMQLVVTCGKIGAFAWAQGQWDFCPAPAVDVISTAGAGDALLGALIACLAAGVPLSVPGRRESARAGHRIECALDYGVLLGSYAATSPHSIHPDASASSLARFAGQIGWDFASTSPFLAGGQVQ